MNITSRVRGKRATFFTTEADLDELYRLARQNLSIKQIAAAIGCSYQTISTSPIAMPIVQQAWVHYVLEIDGELHRLATLDLSEVVPEERAMYSGMKMKALTTIHKEIHKEPFVGAAEEEKIRRMSDEELEAEITRIATSSANKNRTA